jgi:hypothetical protein
MGKIIMSYTMKPFADKLNMLIAKREQNLNERLSNQVLAHKTQLIIAQYKLKNNNGRLLTLNAKTIEIWRKGEKKPTCDRLDALLKVLDADIEETYELKCLAGCPHEPRKIHEVKDSLLSLSTYRRLSTEQLLLPFGITPYPSLLVLLSQHPIKYICPIIISIATESYQNRVHNIVLTKYVDENDFCNSLGIMFGVSSNCYSINQLRYEIVKTVAPENKPSLYLISRLELLKSAEYEQFMGVIDYLTNLGMGIFHFIFLGGGDLQKLMSLSANIQLDNQLQITYWEDWTWEDLNLFFTKQLHIPEEAVAKQLMEISGGHIQLLELCLAWYYSLKSMSTYIEKLSLLTFLGDKFTELLLVQKNKYLLDMWLEHEVIQVAPLNPTWMSKNPLLRELYWKNLITVREAGLCWRCEAIRLAGKQALLDLDKG